MTSVTPDLETRVEEALSRTFTDAFPGVTVGSWSSPATGTNKAIGVKVESEGEDPIGTNIFTTGIEVECQNLDYQERELMRQLIGNSRSAKETLAEHKQGRFSMPKGQPVEVLQSGRTADNENDRIITYTLSASLQPC